MIQNKEFVTRKYDKQTIKMNFRFIHIYIFVNNLRNLYTNKKTHDDSKVIFHHRKKNQTIYVESGEYKSCALGWTLFKIYEKCTAKNRYINNIPTIRVSQKIKLLKIIADCGISNSYDATDNKKLFTQNIHWVSPLPN